MDVFILGYVFYTCVQAVLSTGKIEVRFVRYINHAGSGINGHCCDGKGIFCFSACDHRFVICLDNASANRNINKCAIGRRSTREIPNSNTIQFGASIGGVQNPMKYSIKSWPGTVLLKVDVFDVDDNADDKVDFLIGNFTMQSDKSKKISREQTFRLTTPRTLLDYKVSVYCDENYFGPSCNVFCKDTDNADGHYTCNAKTGEKVCMEGWGGKDCTNNLNDACDPNPCGKNQVCNETTEGYCSCAEGFIGDYCNMTVPLTCEEIKCLNKGLCEIIDQKPVCKCSVGWQGTYCGIQMNPCDSNPCGQNGTCTFHITSGYMCECPEHTRGVHCENISKCLTDEDVCKNGGKCISQKYIDETEESDWYFCNCTDDYSGKHCEINIINETLLQELNGTLLQELNGTLLQELNHTEVLNETRSEDTASSSITTTSLPVNKSTSSTSTTVVENTTEIPPTTTEGLVPSRGLGVVYMKQELNVNKAIPQAFVFLRGRVDKRNQGEIKKSLEKIIHDLTNMKGTLQLFLHRDVYKTNEGDMITKISVQGTVDGQPLNIPELHSVLSDPHIGAVDEYLPLPRYNKHGHTHGPSQLKTEKVNKHVHDSWIHQYWFVVLIVVLGIVAAVMFVVGLVIVKRRKTLESGDNKDNVAKTNTTVTESNNAQSFENSLYFEMNQPKKDNSREKVNFRAMP